MANDPNDISDVQTQAQGGNSKNSPKTLPIRGEKRILPVPINPSAMSDEFEQLYDQSGMNSPEDTGYANTGRTELVQYDDFYVHASKAGLGQLTDFVTIRILNRGQTASGSPDSSTNATYRFLINPSQVQISRSTLDAQAFARSGWQFGIWGEDSVSITLAGKTAGQYWAFGITDRYQQYSQSYRNLEQLQVVFENNGYWFEGEQTAEGPLAANFARRRIKMHQDVELTVGNFIWYGCFEQLEISQNANSPFLADFNLTFVAWKERFRDTSPYGNQIRNDVQRGHAYSAYQKSIDPQVLAKGLPASSRIPPALPDVVGLAPPTSPNVNPNTPSVTTAQITPALPSASPNTSDYTPTSTPATGGAPGAASVSILNTPTPSPTFGSK
jgi:hypothetical protein